jgi:hypothetical protein
MTSRCPQLRKFVSGTGYVRLELAPTQGIEISETEPLVELYLGIKPDAPAKSLSVVPDLPSSWPELSVENLQVGSDQIAVSVRHAGVDYVTTVSAPVGWSLTIGYTLPAKTQVKSVRLNNSPAAFQIVPTNRGEEIHVQTNSGGTQEVSIQTE